MGKIRSELAALSVVAKAAAFCVCVAVSLMMMARRNVVTVVVDEWALVFDAQLAVQKISNAPEKSHAGISQISGRVM